MFKLNYVPLLVSMIFAITCCKKDTDSVTTINDKNRGARYVNNIAYQIIKDGPYGTNPGGCDSYFVQQGVQDYRKLITIRMTNTNSTPTTATMHIAGITQGAQCGDFQVVQNDGYLNGTNWTVNLAIQNKDYFLKFYVIMGAANSTQSCELNIATSIISPFPSTNSGSCGDDDNQHLVKQLQ